MKPDILLQPDKSVESDSADLELVEASRSGVSFLLLTGNLKATSFERYNFPFCHSDSIWDQRLSEVFASVDESRATQLPRQFLVNDHHISIVPTAFFDGGKMESLHTFSNAASTAKVMSQPMANSDSMGIFSVPDVIARVTGTQVRSSKLQWIDSLCRPSTRHQAHLNIGQAEFDLILVDRSGRMVFHNHFQFRAPEDVLYYTSATFESIKWLHTEIQVVLHGNVQKGDETFSLLSKYFARMEFGSRPTALNYAYSFQQVAAHCFPEIFVAACA